MPDGSTLLSPSWRFARFSRRAAAWSRTTLAALKKPDTPTSLGRSCMPLTTNPLKAARRPTNPFWRFSHNEKEEARLDAARRRHGVHDGKASTIGGGIHLRRSGVRIGSQRNFRLPRMLAGRQVVRAARRFARPGEI